MHPGEHELPDDDIACSALLGGIAHVVPPHDGDKPAEARQRFIDKTLFEKARQRALAMPIRSATTGEVLTGVMERLRSVDVPAFRAYLHENSDLRRGEERLSFLESHDASSSLMLEIRTVVGSKTLEYRKFAMPRRRLSSRAAHWTFRYERAPIRLWLSTQLFKFFGTLDHWVLRGPYYLRGWRPCPAPTHQSHENANPDKEPQ